MTNVFARLEAFVTRPSFDSIKTGAEFNKWYWLKTEMVDICKKLGLPCSGRKFVLRDRIMYALDNDGKLLPQPSRKRHKSKFSWATEKLSHSTVITDNVSFGPNFRRFMTLQIGPQFVCHSDFMDWVRASPGKTLLDAIFKWRELDSRKRDPAFRREIANQNMFNQYVRDFLEDNHGRTFEEAHRLWKLKKRLPMKNGFVRYERSDLALREKS